MFCSIILTVKRLNWKWLAIYFVFNVCARGQKSHLVQLVLVPTFVKRHSKIFLLGRANNKELKCFAGIAETWLGFGILTLSIVAD